MKMSRTLLVASIAWLLHGCMVGPDYKKPDVAMPVAYKETPGWSPAQPDDSAPKGDWWAVFHDPLLDQLEPMVSVSNQTVRQSYANYQEALAEGAVERVQPVELADGLDALGDHRQVERARQPDDRVDDRAAAVVDVGHERAVDLQAADRQLGQPRQRRPAGPEVVERDGDAERP